MTKTEFRREFEEYFVGLKRQELDALTVYVLSMQEAGIWNQWVDQLAIHLHEAIMNRESGHYESVITDKTLH